jgi:hypothetical protein
VQAAVVQAVEHVGSSENQDDSDAIAPPVTYESWYCTTERALSWRLFTLGVMVPLLFFVLVGLWCFIAWYRRLYAREIKRRKAFSIARKHLTLYEHQNDTDTLYHLFISLIAARCKVDEVEVSSTYIQQILLKSGFSHEKIVQWNSFFNELEQARFFAQHESNQQLFARAKYWIIELEKRL